MEIEFFTIFFVGFLGGFGHCIGMCGGIVLTYTLKIEENDPLSKPSYWQRIKPQLLYNLGRITTYTFLGQIFGLIGSTLGFILAVRDFQGLLQIFVGLFMIILGIELAGWIPSLSSDSFPGVKTFKQLTAALFSRVNRKNIYILGLVLGFLPCGLVYAAGAKAAASQSLIGGMLTMLAFGLGTFPAMFVTGLTAHLISHRLRRRLYRLAALMVIFLGIIAILRGFDELGWVRIYWLF
jgi:sulfite exporter TauE/SafE